MAARVSDVAQATNFLLLPPFLENDCHLHGFKKAALPPDVVLLSRQREGLEPWAKGACQPNPLFPSLCNSFLGCPPICICTLEQEEGVSPGFKEKGIFPNSIRILLVQKKQNADICWAILQCLPPRSSDTIMTLKHPAQHPNSTSNAQYKYNRNHKGKLWSASTFSSSHFLKVKGNR